MLSKYFIYRLKNKYCIDDYTQIEGFWEAYNDELPSKKHCLHHKYGIVLNKTAEQLKYMGLYEHRYARELQIMLVSDHTHLHHKGKEVSETTRNKQRKPLSEEHKRNISKSTKGKKKNKPAWNKGIPRTEEQKQKQREKMKGRTSWNKGISTPSPIKDKHRVYDNKELNIFHYE